MWSNSRLEKVNDTHMASTHISTVRMYVYWRSTLVNRLAGTWPRLKRRALGVVGRLIVKIERMSDGCRSVESDSFRIILWAME